MWLWLTVRIGNHNEKTIYTGNCFRRASDSPTGSPTKLYCGGHMGSHIRPLRLARMDLISRPSMQLRVPVIQRRQWLTRSPTGCRSQSGGARRRATSMDCPSLPCACLAIQCHMFSNGTRHSNGRSARIPRSRWHTPVRRVHTSSCRGGRPFRISI